MYLPPNEFDYLNLMSAGRHASSDNGASAKVAVLGWCTTHYYAQVLRGLGQTAGFPLETYEAPYGTVEQSVLDDRSPLFAFDPDFVVFLTAVQTIRDRLLKVDLSQRADYARRECERLLSLIRRVADRARRHVVVHGWVVPCERAWGNLSRRVEGSLVHCIHSMNEQLSQAVDELPNVHLVDCDHVASWLGKQSWFDERLWFHGKCFCSLEALPHVASQDLDVLRAVRGKSPKCLVLDLDDTLWGGVIGDDGLDGIRLGELGDGEAFARFQMYLKEIRERGLLLAVCSKNDDVQAKLPFQNHPHMVLGEDDIACFVANWQNKAENIRTIAERLNIGLDSLVFIDNSAFERNLVRELLPAVCVPELPDDPGQYVPYLDSLNLFETVQFSSEDRRRTEFYRANALRLEEQEKFENVADYLSSLEMISEFERLNNYYLPRTEQLVQRTNQFNLTTIRHSAAELQEFTTNSGYFPYCATLKDRFGDNGLVSVLIGQREHDRLQIITWVMSCRVFSRRLEEFMLDRIVEVAREAGIDRLQGRFVPTEKNGIVQTLYSRIGFRQVAESADGTAEWELSISDHVPGDAPIKWATGTYCGVS